MKSGAKTKEGGRLGRRYSFLTACFGCFVQHLSHWRQISLGWSRSWQWHNVTWVDQTGLQAPEFFGQCDQTCLIAMFMRLKNCISTKIHVTWELPPPLFGWRSYGLLTTCRNNCFQRQSPANYPITPTHTGQIQPGTGIFLSPSVEQLEGNDFFLVFHDSMIKQMVGTRTQAEEERWFCQLHTF